MSYRGLLRSVIGLPTAMLLLVGCGTATLGLPTPTPVSPSAQPTLVPPSATPVPPTATPAPPSARPATAQSEKLVAQIDVSSWIAESLILSLDNRRVACVARVGDQYAAVVDGDVGKPYDDVQDIHFSPDSQRVAYVAQVGDQWLVVVDSMLRYDFQRYL